jgi:predicted phage terminase large subunit-like protein
MSNRKAPDFGQIDVQAELYKRSLRDYIRGAWQVVEPETVYVQNWHLDLICDYLTAIKTGDIRNLIINIPPRCMKSLATCVFFPTWLWTSQPSARFLTSSYSDQLAIRDAVKSRRVIESPWYQARWGSVFKMAGDQNEKRRYENDKTGHRIAVGTGGMGTGEGGSIIITDDALKAQDASSDLERLKVNEWWDKTMSTRGNDPKTVSRIVVMQRLHEDDLTGHLVEKMQEEGASQYEHLVLPMRYEPNRFFSSIGLKDPRTTEGELLWPERVPEVEVKKLEVSLGDDAPGQLQQRPTAPGGAIYQSDWWSFDEKKGWRNRYDAEDPNILEKVVARFIVFDTALKDDETNDFTAHAVGDLTADYRLLLRWVGQERLQFPQLTRHIQDNATFWQTHHRILRAVVIEDKTSGTSAIQTLRQTAPPDVAALIQPFMPVGSKEFRARQASVWCARDCVLLPLPSAEAPWLFEFSEGPYGIYKFPRAAHDDMVDAFTMLILYCEYLLAAGWQARQTPNAAGAGV